MHKGSLAAIFGLLVFGGAAQARAAAPPCEAAPVADAPSANEDPLESANRKGYAIHQTLDRFIIRPAATTYHALTPGPIGGAVHNGLVNLSEPVVAINDVLQGHITGAGVSVVRFATNSTIGVLGLADVAKHMGAVHHDNDFGLTLGRHHVKPGPYLFIPLVGPTTVRDLVGSAADTALDPFHWANYNHRVALSTTRTIVGGLDQRAATDAEMKALLADATDPYATLRSVYLQNREGEVSGASTDELKLPDFPGDAVGAPR